MKDNKTKFFGKNLDSVFCTANVTLNSNADSNVDHIPEAFQDLARRVHSRAAECTKKYMSSETSTQQSQILTGNGYSNQLKTLAIDNLYPGIYQPREDFDLNKLQELAESIKQQGIIQPIVVRLTSQGYEIVAGERRWRAAKLAGLTYVAVIISDLDDQSVFACSLIENLQRQDLNPIEEANAYLRLQQEFYLTHEEIAKLTGKSRSVISNSLRLLFLSAKVRGMLKNNLITNGHARALLTLPYEDQGIVAEKVIKSNMTVRGLENYIKKLKKDFNMDRLNDNQHNQYWSDILTNYFKNPVSVDVNLAGKGKIIITVQDIAEFSSRLSATLRPG